MVPWLRVDGIITLDLRTSKNSTLYEEYKTTMAGGGELRSGRAAEHDRKMVREKYVFYTLSLRSAVKKQHFFLLEPRKPGMCEP